MIASVHPLATRAGLEAIKAGGNAVDAAVAVGLTLGVVDSHNSGIGGGCFLLLRLPDGKILAVDGRERAPAAVRPETYRRDGKADTRLSQVGALAPGIPGSLAVYDYVLKRYGRLPLTTHLGKAAALAEEGFPIDRTFAERLKAETPELRQFDSTAKIFLRPDGEPFQEGDVLRQPDLAASYRAIGRRGVGWFYGGPFAEAAENWMHANGGLITVADFRNYKLELRQPVRTTYRGFEIVGFPPPSSGGVHVAQILNILERFPLNRMGWPNAKTAHVIAEAMKLAFADRAYWLGDPDFVRVPTGLASKSYAEALATRIRPDRVVEVPGHGDPPDAGRSWFGKHTTHFTTADADGSWVACTTTLNTAFGSKVVVPGTGILLNNQMDDFSLQPGVTNFFGLVGAEANAVAPGKRPLSSMSPTFVLKDGQPVFSVGAAGGPTIINQAVLAIVQRIDFHTDVETALRRPRFHHQWKPDTLRIEKTIGPDILNSLRQMGHSLEVVDRFGAAQAVAFDPKQQVFTGAADPRGAGLAAGW